LGCWSHRICSEGEEKTLRPLDLEKVQDCYPGSLSEFSKWEKRGALRHKPPKLETPKSRGDLHHRSREKSLTVGSSRRADCNFGNSTIGRSGMCQCTKFLSPKFRSKRGRRGGGQMKSLGVTWTFLGVPHAIALVGDISTMWAWRVEKLGSSEVRHRKEASVRASETQSSEVSKSRSSEVLKLL
jgi:hypothetical protein